MRRGIVPGILLSLSLTAPLRAESPDPYESKVQGLTHPRYAEREKAARELIAVGEPALKALRAVSGSPDPELRARAAIVAEKIDRVIRSERLLVAPKLALKLDKVPLAQALTQVGQKSGLRFQLEPGKETNPQRPVTLDTGDVPFWEAIDAFYAAAGVVENDLRAVGGDPDARSRIYSGRLTRATSEVIRLTDGKSTSALITPDFKSKAIRVRALPATHPQNRFDGATGEFTLNLDLDAAPALAMQEMIGVEIRRATTDDRQVLAPAYPATASPFGFDGVEQLLIARQVVIVNGEMLIEDGTGGTGFFPVTLKSGVTRPRKLSDLEGVVVARVVAPPEPLITVSDVFAKGKDKSIHNNDRSIQIIDANPGSETNQATLRIRVVAAADSVNEILNFPVQLKGRVRPFVRINRKSGESTQAMPEFQLRDSEGKVIKSTPQVTGSSFDGTTASFEVILKVDRPASGFENVNLTLTGRRSVIVEMPFVLKDVPLP